MAYTARTRVARSFRPSINGDFYLESRIVLDASTIPAEVQAAMDAKTQLKDDMTQYKLDYIIYQNNKIIYNQDAASLGVDINQFRADVKQFNATYAPNRASTKLTVGVGLPTLTCEFNLDNLLGGTHTAAQNERDSLQTRADNLDLERKAMNLRAQGLKDTIKKLDVRKALLDVGAGNEQSKIECAVYDEMRYNVAVTDFSDPDLDQLSSDVSLIYNNLMHDDIELTEYIDGSDTFDDEYNGSGNYGGGS